MEAAARRKVSSQTPIRVLAFHQRTALLDVARHLGRTTEVLV